MPDETPYADTLTWEQVDGLTWEHVDGLTWSPGRGGATARIGCRAAISAVVSSSTAVQSRIGAKQVTASIKVVAP